MMRVLRMEKRLPLVPEASTSVADDATLPNATVLTSQRTVFIMSMTAMMLYCCPPLAFRYSCAVARRERVRETRVCERTVQPRGCTRCRARALMSASGSASSRPMSALQICCATCESGSGWPAGRDAPPAPRAVGARQGSLPGGRSGARACSPCSMYGATMATTGRPARAGGGRRDAAPAARRAAGQAAASWRAGAAACGACGAQPGRAALAALVPAPRRAAAAARQPSAAACAAMPPAAPANRPGPVGVAARSQVANQSAQAKGTATRSPAARRATQAATCAAAHAPSLTPLPPGDSCADTARIRPRTRDGAGVGGARRRSGLPRRAVQQGAGGGEGGGAVRRRQDASVLPDRDGCARTLFPLRATRCSRALTRAHPAAQAAAGTTSTTASSARRAMACERAPLRPRTS
jgi:hypothetical protein